MIALFPMPVTTTRPLLASNFSTTVTNLASRNCVKSRTASASMRRVLRADSMMEVLVFNGLGRDVKTVQFIHELTDKIVIFNVAKVEISNDHNRTCAERGAKEVLRFQ